MATELIVNSSLPETRIALVEDGEIQELLIERASGRGIVGNIYKGRVTRVLPGMQAAFVDIGLDKAAFLYVDDVYVHSEIWEDEEGSSDGEAVEQFSSAEPTIAQSVDESSTEGEGLSEGNQIPLANASDISPRLEVSSSMESTRVVIEVAPAVQSQSRSDFEDEVSDEEQGPSGEGLFAAPERDDAESVDASSSEFDAHSEGSEEQESDSDEGDGDESDSEESSSDVAGLTPSDAVTGAQGEGEKGGRRRRHRRGRRGGRGRRGNFTLQLKNPSGEGTEPGSSSAHHAMTAAMDEAGHVLSDRVAMAPQLDGSVVSGEEVSPSELASRRSVLMPAAPSAKRPEFQMQRSRDRRIKSKEKTKGVREQVLIQNLLKEGQEVIVQVAKDPIATKGARLTCHISLPGRHLVCMPTIDHVGVSRRIERDDERRKLREAVERNRPKKLGFIVRTASGKGNSEHRIKQDIDYLSRLWEEIREKAAQVSAPSMVYEDLNSVLRAIRDWVTEDIDKVIVDSRHHFSEIQRFVGHFMPSLRSKVDLYHGDIPIFDAYGISTELARALERKVWLKSGGYLVIDQAEALVAIDVNTGRFVGKKNLEDTILKTNLEAVQEIAYQLRLRNCGGIIILDLIDMEKEENKQRVYRALEEALKKDRARPTIQKISDLGLIEMTRKRTRDTIVRTLCEPCSHCEGKGYIKNKQTVAYEALREIERDGIEREANKILVQAHPDVIDILAIEERDTIDLLERRYKKQVYLQAVFDFHPEQYEVATERKDRQPGDRDSQRESPRDRTQRSRDRNRDRERGKSSPATPQVSQEQFNDSSLDSEGMDLSPSTDPTDDMRGEDGLPASGVQDQKPEQSQGGGRQSRDRNRGRHFRERQGGGSSGAPRGLIAPRAIETASSIQESKESSESGDRQTIVPTQLLKPSFGEGSPEGRQGPGLITSSAAEGSLDEIDSDLDSIDTDGAYDEEDRLAFLRAQAAQDAALASFGAHPGGGGPAARPSPGPGAGGFPRKPGGRRRRGRRGGSRGGGRGGAPGAGPAPGGEGSNGAPQ